MSTLLALKGHPLADFLAKRSNCKQNEASVAGMSGGGRWLVTDDDYPEFLDLMHDYLFVKGNRSVNLVEQPRLNSHKPLLIDLDFHYPEGKGLNRSFTEEHIRMFCAKLVDGLEHFFTLPQNNETLRFFVTLRPSPYQDSKKKIGKDGVHIECPDLCISNEKQKVLRSWLLGQSIVESCFSGTGYDNPDEEVYDESMTRKQAWFFYGESKPDIPRYELAHVFSYNPTTKALDVGDVEEYTPRELMELLSLRYNLVPDSTTIRDAVVGEYNAIANPPLPKVKEPEVNTGPILEAVSNYINGMNTRNEEEKGIIQNMVLNCLSIARANSYDSWIRVGWCLHNIEASEDMFKLWVEFSKKSPSFQEGEVVKWRRDWFGRMRKDGDGPRLTEMSLRKWARDDNPTAYQEIIENNILEYIRVELDGTHFHIAKLMQKLYNSNYVASINQKTVEWYFYDDAINMWKHLNQGMQLRRNISFDVAKYISKARDKIRATAFAPNSTNTEKEAATAQLAKLTKIESNLYNTGFVESTMKMAATFFCQEDFHTKLNSNVFLFGCANGVLELRSRSAEVIPPSITREHVVFRDGRPEDYVSFLAGQGGLDVPPINYIPLKNLNEEQRGYLVELKDFFTKIMPRPEVRAYLLRLIASCLEGTNREQCFYYFTGKGGNGKSKLQDLCRLTFGDYWTSMATTVLTRKRPDSGAANPEIMVVKNKRFITMQEPDDKEPINTSRMKQFSGEDIIEARALFQDQEKFKITGKLFMLCNDLPPVNSMDGGTWRRIRVVPFESKFVTAEDPDYIAKKPNVYLRDGEIDHKFMLWRETFLSWLVDIYENEYLVNGLEPIPLIVKNAASEYKESYDTFAKFRNERIRKSVGEQCDFKQINRAYTQWLSDARRSGSKLTPKALQSRLHDEYGEPSDGKTYKHIIVFGDEGDVEEFDSKVMT